MVLLDEVNTKIEGLDVKHRRDLVKKFKYENPAARHMAAVKLGRWDGKVPYFQLGGSTYINLLPEIIPLLEDWGYELEIDDKRTGFIPEFEPVNANVISDRTWPDGHPVAGQPIVLRDYQVEAINTFLKNPQSMQEIATGAGKTIITALMADRCEKYGRTLVIVPSKTLVNQTREDFENIGLDVGVYFGSEKHFGRTHTICTWQSLNNIFKNKEMSFEKFAEGVNAVIVDEAHGAKAEVLKSMLSGPLSHVSIRWGLTGTIPKEEFNSKALTCSIGEVVGKVSTKSLQNSGILSACHVSIMQLKDYVEYNSYATEYKYLVTNQERVQYLSQMVNKITSTGNTLVLVDRIATGKMLNELIPNSVFVSGGTKDTERIEHYNSIRTEDDKCIIATYGVAAVGINMPRLFNLILIEPGKSFVRVIQSIGRGVRKAPDKNYIDIFDITSDCKYAKRHLRERKRYYKEAEFPFTIEKIDWKL